MTSDAQEPEIPRFKAAWWMLGSVIAILLCTRIVDYIDLQLDAPVSGKFFRAVYARKYCVGYFHP